MNEEGISQRSDFRRILKCKTKDPSHDPEYAQAKIRHELGREFKEIQCHGLPNLNSCDCLLSCSDLRHLFLLTDEATAAVAVVIHTRKDEVEGKQNLQFGVPLKQRREAKARPKSIVR